MEAQNRHDAKGSVSYACVHLQRPEQTFTLFLNKSACSAVDEANFQDHRTRKGLTTVTKGKKPSEVEANGFEWQLMQKFQLLSLLNQRGNFCYVLNGLQHFCKVAVPFQRTGEGKC